MMSLFSRSALVVPFVVVSLAPAGAAGLFGSISGNDIHSIGKSLQDVGKSINKSISEDTLKKAFPETEHSPSDPCATNAKLPQCDLQKGEPNK